MGQRTQRTVNGKARAKRTYGERLARETVRRTSREQSFRRRWIEPTVIHVVDDADAWSAYLRRMTSRPDWSVAKLSRLSGIARSTLFRWMAEGAEAVTIESVHRVADALGDDRANAVAAAANLPPARDEEVDLILSSDRTEREKVQMIDRLMRRREEEKARRLEDLRFVLGDGEQQAG